MFLYAVSFESDALPVDTYRGVVEAGDFAESVRRAVFRAEKERGKKRTVYGSLTVLVESASPPVVKKANKTGPLPTATPEESAA